LHVVDRGGNASIVQYDLSSETRAVHLQAGDLDGHALTICDFDRSVGRDGERLVVAPCGKFDLDGLLFLRL
jgi:hypothetical protein